MHRQYRIIVIYQNKTTRYNKQQIFEAKNEEKTLRTICSYLLCMTVSLCDLFVAIVQENCPNVLIKTYLIIIILESIHNSLLCDFFLFKINVDIQFCYAIA